MKLFVIGDSMSQATMSAAIAQGELSYWKLMASVMGDPITIPTYRWPGMRVNLEHILRVLERKFGSNVAGLEWPLAINAIRKEVADEEYFYERGPGRIGAPRDGHVHFPNVSIDGYQVGDAWMLNAARCREIAEASPKGHSDNFFETADKAFYRNGCYILNPSYSTGAFDKFSQLDWLKHHAESEGVENVIVALGANNCLGTVLHLRVNQSTVVDGKLPHELDHSVRADKGWNLWLPEHFEAEYKELTHRLLSSVSGNVATTQRIILTTVPHVTIAPIITGRGATFEHPRGTYFEMYTYPFLEEEEARKHQMYLAGHDAVFIDDTIDEYNKTIKAIAGSDPRFQVFDLADLLARLAWRRNNGNPPYQLPGGLQWRHPRVNTRYYHADRDGAVKAGGLFSLDGVHPSAVGHGIIAHELLGLIRGLGDASADPTKLNWDAIWESDRLLSAPIRIMHELYDKGAVAAFLASKGSLPGFLLDVARNLV